MPFQPLTETIDYIELAGLRSPGISCIEYREPVFALATPQGAQDRPLDPVDQSISALSGIVQNGGEGDVLGPLANLGGA